MHRLTARALLFLLLLSAFAPVVLAASTPEHACCARKCCAGKPPHTHPASETAFDSPSCCHQDCACSTAISIWADVPASSSPDVISPALLLSPDAHPFARSHARNPAHLVRGPPSSFIA